MTSTRYTRTDLANILGNVNAAAARLGMTGAGAYAVEDVNAGGFYSLTDRTGLDPSDTRRGERLVPLGPTVHRAAETLLRTLDAWHTVEMMRDRAVTVTLTAEQVENFREGIREARRAADGDSNDGEIGALTEVVSDLADALGMPAEED